MKRFFVSLVAALFLIAGIASAQTIPQVISPMVSGGTPADNITGTGTDNRYGLFDGTSVLEAGLLSDDGTNLTQTGTGSYILPDAGAFRFTTEATGIYRDAADTLAQRRTTNAQTFNIYGTFTDSSNYERLAIGHDGTDGFITMQEGGTGVDNAHLKLSALGSLGELHFETADTIRFFDSSFNFLSLTGGAAQSSATQVAFALPLQLSDTSGIQLGYIFSGTFAPASGTPREVFFDIAPVIDWGGTPGAGSYEALLIDATETAPPTGINYLIRTQVSAQDIFTVQSTGVTSFGNQAEGGTGKLNIQTTTETHTLASAATSTTTGIDIPSSAKIIGCQLTVNTAVSDDGGDDTWRAQYTTGLNDQDIAAAGTAAAQNTKVNTFFDTHASTTDIADAETNIIFTAQGGSFDAGVIEILCYYYDLTSMADA